jgi:hypothetical protein
MSESNTGERLIKTWSAAQQKLLTGWLDLVQRTEGTSRAVVWNETVIAWQTAVQETLDTQAEWLRDWSKRLQAELEVPPELRKNLQQEQELLLKWTETQQQLWQGWFDLVQKLAPLFEAGTGFQVDEKLLPTWQEAARKMVEAQTEWVRRWTTGIPDKPEK